MKWTLTVALLLACFGFNEALDCYQCSGTNCGDPYAGTEAQRTTCGFPLNDACYKSKAGTIVIRGCYSSLLCAAAEYAGINACKDSSEGAHCCCTGNLCNAASTRGISYVALAATMLLAWTLAAF